MSKTNEEKSRAATPRKRCLARDCEGVVLRGELCGPCRDHVEHARFNNSQACQNVVGVVARRLARDLVPRCIMQMIDDGRLEETDAARR